MYVYQSLNEKYKFINICFQKYPMQYFKMAGLREMDVL